MDGNVIEDPLLRHQLQQIEKIRAGTWNAGQYMSGHRSGESLKRKFLLRVKKGKLIMHISIR